MEYFKTLESEDVGELDYQVYFNIPDLPEKELEADVRRTIHAFFRLATSFVSISKIPVTEISDHR